MVKSYLVHYGYVETLQEIEEPTQVKEEQKEDMIAIIRTDRKMTEDVSFTDRDDRFLSDVSDQPTNLLRSGRSESFSGLASGYHQSTMISLGRRINRSESLFVPPNISNTLVEKVQK